MPYGLRGRYNNNNNNSGYNRLNYSRQPYSVENELARIPESSEKYVLQFYKPRGRVDIDKNFVRGLFSEFGDVEVSLQHDRLFTLRFRSRESAVNAVKQQGETYSIRALSNEWKSSRNNNSRNDADGGGDSDGAESWSSGEIRYENYRGRARDDDVDGDIIGDQWQNNCNDSRQNLSENQKKKVDDIGDRQVYVLNLPETYKLETLMSVFKEFNFSPSPTIYAWKVDGKHIHAKLTLESSFEVIVSCTSADLLEALKKAVVGDEAAATAAAAEQLCLVPVIIKLRHRINVADTKIPPCFSIASTDVVVSASVVAENHHRLPEAAGVGRGGAAATRADRSSLDVMRRSINAFSTQHNNQSPSAADVLEKSLKKASIWNDCPHWIKQCISFPRCQYGKKCPYRHPDCKYGKTCLRRASSEGCVFVHPSDIRLTCCLCFPLVEADDDASPAAAAATLMTSAAQRRLAIDQRASAAVAAKKAACSTSSFAPRGKLMPFLNKADDDRQDCAEYPYCLSGKECCDRHPECALGKFCVDDDCACEHPQ